MPEDTAVREAQCDNAEHCMRHSVTRQSAKAEREF